ncbi:MAG: serine/threonine protein kinase, partial [Planctomycetales bacterium]|nr:serine/threonine protein kinase [Planctomycetales bacterium]
TTAFDSSGSSEAVDGGATSAALPKEFGRYRIQKQLGQGGMGSVLLAHDSQLDRQVALKIPKLAADQSGKLTERFLREARAVAGLSHPNICPVFDVGKQGDVHFLAMGYVEGRPLSDFVSETNPPAERQAAQVIRKAALALQEAHDKGILHRDLKPANIMIDRRSEPIVMDFGLACRWDDTETRLTQEGTIIGTPAYMSPEQIEDAAAIGPASDIYSLGVVMYELLTGRCPFEGSVVSVIGAVLHSTPRPVEELRKNISPEMAAIVARAMAKRPEDRFGSMKDFAAALTAFLKGESTVTAKPQLEPLPVSSALDDVLSEAAAAAPAPLGPIMSPQRSKPIPYAWIGGGAAAAALLIVGGIVVANMVSGTGGGRRDNDNSEQTIAAAAPVAPAETKPTVSTPATPSVPVTQPETPTPLLPPPPVILSAIAEAANSGSSSSSAGTPDTNPPPVDVGFPPV